MKEREIGEVCNMYARMRNAHVLVDKHEAESL